MIRALAITLVLACSLPAAGAESGCTPTRADAQGPFYVPNAPERSATGRGLVVSGVVRSARQCTPLAGARIEWWSANSRGDYDGERRASQRVDAGGRYRYETVFPGRYPGRPPHLHVRVTAPGHKPLVTQLYPAPGQVRLDTDFVLDPD